MWVVAQVVVLMKLQTSLRERGETGRRRRRGREGGGEGRKYENDSGEGGYVGVA